MKILHALASYEIGGGEMMALRLARWQKQQGETVCVVALSGAGPLAEAFTDAGVETHVVQKKEGFDRSLFWRLGSFIRRVRPCIVHSHNPQSLVYAAAPARALRSKVVHTKHGEAADLGRRFWLRRGAGALLHAFVSVSAQTDAFAKKHLEAAPWIRHTIENGVETAGYGPSSEARKQLVESLGFDRESFIIGTVARLQAVKNHCLLVEAAAPHLGRKCQLVLVGDGPEEAAIRQRAEDLGVNNHVHLLGYRADVQALMGAFDCFAMSSITEGLPLVVLEAMASELPIVSTAVGGIPDAVAHGRCGLLTEPGDAAALGEALKKLMDEPETRRKMGAEARHEVARHHSIERMASRYQALYRSLLGS